MSPGAPETWVVDGREVRMSSPDRVLWPATGTTKRDLAAYYLAAAPAILPHIAGRGLTLHRFPAGVEERGWYQAQCRGSPPWLATQDVVGVRGDLLRYCVVDDPAGLAFLAHLSCIELHPFLGTAARPEEPTMLVLDLDPSPPAGLLDAASVALEARALLQAAALPSQAKVSGARGVHVLVGLRPGQTFAATKAVARAIGERLARERPELVTARLGRRAGRRGLVLVDWLQNDPTRSTIAAWSPRATPVPLVAAPAEWDEVEAAVRTGDPGMLRFGFQEALARIRSRPDAVARLLDPAQGVVLPPAAAFL